MPYLVFGSNNNLFCIGATNSSVEQDMSIDTYYVSIPICRECDLKSQCTTGVNRRMSRWEHEDVLEKMPENLEQMPEAMTLRASTVEHPFGTINYWNGSRHFLMKQLKNYRTEIGLNVLAYNLRRMISIVGVAELIKIMEEIVLSKLRALVSRFQQLKSRSVITSKPNFWKLSFGTSQLSAI